MKLFLTPSTALVFVLGLGSLSAASPGAPPTKPHSKPIQANDFIHVDGLRLKDSHGKTQYLTGLNYWACMNLAADADAGGQHARFLAELDQMQALGVNHLRIMAGSEGAPTPQPFRMRPALQPAPGRYNEKVFVGLDRCLAEMAKRGMRATMTLNDQWQWSGGFAQYISWAHGNEQIGYPPSWNISAAPQRPGPPGRGWGDYTTTGSFTDFVVYGNRIYTDKAAERAFLAHIDTVMSRVNTVNGRCYRDDATIMTWQLANEPQPEGQPTVTGKWFPTYAPNPQDPMLAWIDRISTYIKQRAPRQLVTPGMESKQGEWYYKAAHSFANVDYGTAHCWVQNWGVYDMNDASAANLQNAKDFATQFIHDTNQWAVDIGKPIFLEEFGMARDNWQNDVSKGVYQYSSHATTTHKDNYFRHIIGLAMNAFKSDKGAYVGTCPWAYGGVYRPEKQKQNKFGMVWAGDPPHEAPGWYDLYDTDNALKIIKHQKKDIDTFLSNKS